MATPQAAEHAWLQDIEAAPAIRPSPGILKTRENEVAQSTRKLIEHIEHPEATSPMLNVVEGSTTTKDLDEKPKLLQSTHLYTPEEAPCPDLP